MGAQALQVVVTGTWAVGEPIGTVCKGHGRVQSHDFKEQKTGVRSQEPNVKLC